jgi:hypothetical protein
MNPPIGPEDMVECINNGPMPAMFGGPPVDARMLTVGAVYRVKDLLPPLRGIMGVTLYGVDLGEDDAGFRVERFKPVSHRGDFEKTLESLRATAHDLKPIRELEPA